MSNWARVLVALVLAGCVDAMPQPQPYSSVPAPVQPAAVAAAPVLPPSVAVANFRSVVARVEPLAVQICLAAGRARNCDFRIVIDDRPNQPANAFQTLDDYGRPILAFTTALIADARNPDELAFVLGHESAHHILGHIPQSQQNAMTGALLAGVLAAAGGLDQTGVEQAQRMGAVVASRSYSKEFELQADALGAEIAYRAGFDPVRGSAFFDRLPDPGDRFLGSHPANADRKAAIRRVMLRLQTGG